MGILELQSRIAALSPPSCRKCPGQRGLVADATAPSKRYYDKDGYIAVISKGLVPHESGLCYYHLKREQGWFDAKYPLYKYRRRHSGPKKHS